MGSARAPWSLSSGHKTFVVDSDFHTNCQYDLNQEENCQFWGKTKYVCVVLVFFTLLGFSSINIFFSIFAAGNLWRQPTSESLGDNKPEQIFISTLPRVIILTLEERFLNIARIFSNITLSHEQIFISTLPRVIILSGEERFLNIAKIFSNIMISHEQIFISALQRAIILSRTEMILNIAKMF